MPLQNVISKLHLFDFRLVRFPWRLICAASFRSFGIEYTRVEYSIGYQSIDLKMIAIDIDGAS